DRPRRHPASPALRLRVVRRLRCLRPRVLATDEGDEAGRCSRRERGREGGSGRMTRRALRFWLVLAVPLAAAVWFSACGDDRERLVPSAGPIPDVTID